MDFFFLCETLLLVLGDFKSEMVALFLLELLNDLFYDDLKLLPGENILLFDPLLVKDLFSLVYLLEKSEICG